MKNAINNQVGMLGNMFLWLVANLKQGVIYFIKQEGGNHKIAWVYVLPSILLKYFKIVGLLVILQLQSHKFLQMDFLMKIKIELHNWKTLILPGTLTRF